MGATGALILALRQPPPDWSLLQPGDEHDGEALAPS